MNIKTILSKKIVWLGVVIIPLAAISTKAELGNSDSSYTGIIPTKTNTCNCYATDSTSYILPITFHNIVPGDLFTFNHQILADCFAWQQFISLNWPTNPSSDFGTPHDYSFVQWETYMHREVMFKDDGSRPPAWGTMVSDEYSRMFKTQKLLFNKTDTKLLTFVNKIEENGAAITFTPDQASPVGKPSWLGAQNFTNLWYEIMLNKDYYDFIVEKGFYNAKVQHDTIKRNLPINFPQGEYNGIVGAIELKAAWMEVVKPELSKWKRYKLSKAIVLDPITRRLRRTVVALVGLHILHKTQNQPTWVWATFEHIDNVPDRDNLNTSSPPPDGYNFYDPKCKDREVKIRTPNGDSLVIVPCIPNTPPRYYLNQAGPVPIQTVRVNSIDKNNAAPINALMQRKIKKFYPNSVWQYYELIDVIWSQSIQPDPTVPIRVPRNINRSTMLSGAGTVIANSTMETYVQSTKTCFDCHIFSTIAPYSRDTINNSKFGDFSFALTFAKYPAAKSDYLKKMKKKK